MIDSLIFNNNNEYVFDESIHTYYWNGSKVETSVTSFISKYFEEFDLEGISKRYADKHGLLQEDVKKQWKDKGDISSLSGTIIHAYLENANNNKIIIEDYSKANEANLYDSVKERVDILLPKAKKFISDTKNKLIPLKLEYTVGLEDLLAGNIDMLAWNKKANEVQIWDYKNLKEMKLENKYKKCFKPFDSYDDCNFIHYSMQLSFYKAMAQRLLGIDIGKMYLVHFNYLDKSDNYDIYQAIDFTDICNRELDNLKKSKEMVYY